MMMMNNMKHKKKKKKKKKNCEQVFLWLQLVFVQYFEHRLEDWLLVFVQFV
eukprot:CAMPEP_0201545308 /NCGR_PEP_ID=MMETSP0173_2-20130828/1834_1 /ASSEMBLY_ACC=CAM_ASM_000268 /TAXON_ID=218659 /ORGANISM="Vexillifera sp., Strain DIVA3 564/2" /LENGTH=50 /DNA_ID=CAMNT_0047953669 /DNA_START=1105 /DNA_END=1254 /DNA_ORIENTATION=-